MAFIGCEPSARASGSLPPSAAERRANLSALISLRRLVRYLVVESTCRPHLPQTTTRAKLTCGSEGTESAHAMENSEEVAVTKQGSVRMRRRAGRL